MHKQHRISEATDPPQYCFDAVVMLDKVNISMHMCMLSNLSSTASQCAVQYCTALYKHNAS